MNMHRHLPWLTSLQRSYLPDQLEDEVQSIDISEESKTSHSPTMIPPLGMRKRKQLPHPPVVSVFEVRAYDEARSLSSHKLSRSLHEQHIKEAKDRLQDVQAEASEGASKAPIYHGRVGAY
ncbi:UNVERIFIED_CONTAM: hypothetical protein Sradi_4031600 [Sesamum radiatum]|uniref:Uncharacterized protein n=1 Tax=Sesamum radiatum TaxID=300843 RepID=A0AAW2PI02_SESRA